jgi:hypothetical protein
MYSTIDHESAILEKSTAKLRLVVCLDFFLSPHMPNLHILPIGVVPKADGGWRMITHLSYPLPLVLTITMIKHLQQLPTHHLTL